MFTESDFGAVCRDALSPEWIALGSLMMLQVALFTSAYRKLSHAQSEVSAAVGDLQFAERTHTLQHANHEQEIADVEMAIQTLADEIEDLDAETNDTDVLVQRMSQQRDALIRSVSEMNKALEENVSQTEACVAKLDARVEELETECLAIEDTIVELREDCASIREHSAAASLERRDLSIQRSISQAAAAQMEATATTSSMEATRRETHAPMSRMVIPDAQVAAEAEYKAARKLNDFLLNEAERIWNGEIREHIDRVTRNKETINALTVKMGVLQHRNDLALEAKQLLQDIRVVETAVVDGEEETPVRA